MSLEFWIIDSETTGLSHKWHEMFQLSLIHHPDKQQLSRYISAEHPERASDQSLAITGKTREQIVLGDSKEDVVAKMDEFLSQHGKTAEHRVIVGHNVNFDMRFSHALWESCGKRIPVALWLDTKELAHAFAKKMGITKPKLHLEAALTLTGAQPTNGTAHDAIKDARDCYRLFTKLIEEGIDYLPKIKRIPHL